MDYLKEQSENAAPPPEKRGAHPTRSQLFRAMLASPELTFLMEAHDGLSARVVEVEGFEGIWASGFSISTALGLRDSNEASWTQVLNVVECMTDSTSIPIILDGDTGYGNFNNARLLVKKLCRLGVAGICLEDKVFPKNNSFIGNHHPLASIEEFCGKLKACMDSRTDDDFAVIARVEALIAGRSQAEALRRAEAYSASGADAILIHSRKPCADEILAFAAEWDNRIPLVISPTTYFSTPTDAYRHTGISVLVWASHNIRASLTAMLKLCREVRKSGTTAGIEGDILSIQEVFDFMDYAELADAERRYLHTREWSEEDNS